MCVRVCVPPATSADLLINSRFFALWNAQTFFFFFLVLELIAIRRFVGGNEKGAVIFSVYCLNNRPR